MAEPGATGPADPAPREQSKLLERVRALLATELGRLPLWAALGSVVAALLALACVLSLTPLKVQLTNSNVPVVWVGSPGPVITCCTSSSYQPESVASCPTGCTCANAMDSDLSTRWASRPNTDEWIAFHFAKPVPIDGVGLRWAAAYARDYVIEDSNDGVIWSTVHIQREGKGGNEEVHFPAFTTRNLRMRGLTRATPWGYSLWEFEIFRGGIPLSLVLDASCGSRDRVPVAKAAPTLPAQPDSSPLDEVLMLQAWTAFAGHEYLMTLSVAEECTREFEEQALALQRAFTVRGDRPPPIGKPTEAERKEVFSRRVLNNVGLCYFISGQASEALGRVVQAQARYEAVRRFPAARAYDPVADTFWSPAQAAAERLAQLDKGPSK